MKKLTLAPLLLVSFSLFCSQISGEQANEKNLIIAKPVPLPPILMEKNGSKILLLFFSFIPGHVSENFNSIYEPSSPKLELIVRNTLFDHSSKTTTQSYLHSHAEQKRSAANSLMVQKYDFGTQRQNRGIKITNDVEAMS